MDSVRPKLANIRHNLDTSCAVRRSRFSQDNNHSIVSLAPESQEKQCVAGGVCANGLQCLKSLTRELVPLASIPQHLIIYHHPARNVTILLSHCRDMGHSIKTYQEIIIHSIIDLFRRETVDDVYWHSHFNMHLLNAVKGLEIRCYKNLARLGTRAISSGTRRGLNFRTPVSRDSQTFKAFNFPWIDQQVSDLHQLIDLSTAGYRSFANLPAAVRWLLQSVREQPEDCYFVRLRDYSGVSSILRIPTCTIIPSSI